MSNEKRFSYFLVAALAASFSADATAQETTDLLDRDPEGEWQPANELDSAPTSMIETENGWGVEIDRVRFHGEGFDVELQTRGKLDDLQIVLRADDERAAPEVRDVAGWLERNLAGGDRLFRQTREWSFSGKLYAPGVDGTPGDRAVAIEGELPLEIEVARSKSDPSVVVGVTLPRDHFEIDWRSFREQLPDSNEA